MASGANRSCVSRACELAASRARGRAARVRRVGRGDQVAHRLRALGELDQHDADVLDHRQQHLAQVFGLRRRAPPCARRLAQRHGADRAHARDADHQLRDFVAGFRGELLLVEAGAVRHADQQRGAHRFGIELELGDDRRGAGRAGEPGFAFRGQRIAITLARELEGRLDRRALGGRVAARRLRDARGVERVGRRGLRRGMNQRNHAPIIPARARRLSAGTAELTLARNAELSGVGDVHATSRDQRSVGRDDSPRACAGTTLLRARTPSAPRCDRVGDAARAAVGGVRLRALRP